MAWDTFLDPFVLAYREDPSDENRRLLLLAQEAYHRAFLREQARDFIARTRAGLR